MKLLRFFMLCLLMLAQPLVNAVWADDATPTSPMTNQQIRAWYNEQVERIPDLDLDWQKQGLTLEQRARKAYDIRHHARIKAREMMVNRDEVADLQKRDQQVYGHPDGPTFEQLVAKNIQKGMTQTAAYEDVIGSAYRTNAAYNAKYGTTPKSTP